MYSIPYLFNYVYVFIGCIDFGSWLGLACIALFLIFTVHSYVAPTLNKFFYLFIRAPVRFSPGAASVSIILVKDVWCRVKILSSEKHS